MVILSSKGLLWHDELIRFLVVIPKQQHAGVHQRETELCVLRLLHFLTECERTSIFSERMVPIFMLASVIHRPFFHHLQYQFSHGGD